MKSTPINGHLQLDSINANIQENPAEFIKAIDRDYHAYIRNVANSIASIDHHKIVMLSGPSGSGKTTTAQFMQKYMNDLGIETICISLDNFYLGRNNAPRLPDGGGGLVACSLCGLNYGTWLKMAWKTFAVMIA